MEIELDSEDQDEVESSESAQPEMPEATGEANTETAPPPQGAYNPDKYNGLNVDDDVRELFDYITRYKAQNIELETPFRPFIPDYIPAIGEVDAALKGPKPDGEEEDLGITVLDEPALNQSDKAFLELKYIQISKAGAAAKA